MHIIHVSYSKYVGYSYYIGNRLDPYAHHAK